MAKFLISLLLLLGTSNVLAQSCYCTDQRNPTTGNCYANATCWACAPGAYNTSWQQAYCTAYTPPAPTCTYSATTEQRACPVNYSGTQTWKRENNCIGGSATDSGWFKVSDTCTPLPATCKASSESRQEVCGQNQNGSKTYSRQSTCPDPYGQPVWGPWQLTQDTCKWNPPTCQPSTQTQTLSCQAGFTGSITQTMTSTCPNPYGQPVWGSWVASSNTCVKSVTNPTNVLSPVSPLNPSSPVMSAPATPIAPVTAPVVSAPMTTQATETPEAPSVKSEPAPQSQTPSGTSAAPSAVNSAPQPSVGSGAKAAALVQRLTLIGAMPKQPNIVEQIVLKQELPDEYRRTQDFLLELIKPNDSWLDRDFPSDHRWGGIYRSDLLGKND